MTGGVGRLMDGSGKPPKLSLFLYLFAHSGPATVHPMPFEIPSHELSDAEIAAILRDIIAALGLDDTLVTSS